MYWYVQQDWLQKRINASGVVVMLIRSSIPFNALFHHKFINVDYLPTV